MQAKSSVVTRGVLPLLVTAVIWGGMFPVATSILQSMDAFHLTLIRYGITALIFAALLRWHEGSASFASEGRVFSVAALGTLGFAGFSLLVFSGLALSRPEHAAVIMATMPLLTALLTWAVRGVRPSRLTFGAIGVALLGVLLVVSKGRADFLHEGSIVGDLMVLAGALCWVAYTMGGASFPQWSALRYTTLTTLAGAVAIAIATLAAVELGIAHPTDAAAIVATGWQIVYMIALASVFAVLAWNRGMQVLGAANGVLFSNFVPITAFAIRAWQGQRYGAPELLGAVLVIGALLANNLVPRLMSQARPAARNPVARLEGACAQ